MHFSVQELLRWIVMGFLILFIFNITFVMFQISQINNYESIVDSYIESHGQLDASTINTIMQKQYGQEFTIAPLSDSDTKPHDFGDKVYYTITIKIPFLMVTSGPAISNSFSGYAISEISQ